MSIVFGWKGWEWSSWSYANYVTSVGLQGSEIRMRRLLGIVPLIFASLLIIKQQIETGQKISKSSDFGCEFLVYWLLLS